MMKDLIQKYQLPGGSLAVSQGGKLVYAESFGWADRDARHPVRDDSLFRIASVSKPITAVAVMKLIEQGKIKLDEKVYPMFKDVPVPQGLKENPEIYKITVEDLLRHSSGQAGYNNRGVISSPMQPPLSYKISQLFKKAHPPGFLEILGYMKTQKLLHPVGKNFKYSNYAFALLGELIHRKTGASYEDFVRGELMKPIGITCMRMGRSRRKDKWPKEVIYYDLPGSSAVPSVFNSKELDIFPYAGRNHEAWGAGGAWVSSAVDLLKFVNHVDGLKKPALLKPSSVQRMLGEQSFPENKPGFYYGLGWRVQKKKNGRHFYHNGSSSVGAVPIMLRTNDGWGWVALFNRRMKNRDLHNEFNKRMWKIKKSYQAQKRDLFSEKTCQAND